MRVICQDGHKRMCRVRGKMKKRNWVREGDIVLISPWDFEYEAKGDIIFRYTQNQAIWLREAGLLKMGLVPCGGKQLSHIIALEE